MKIHQDNVFFTFKELFLTPTHQEKKLILNKI
jgi:hypothetical protein